MRADTEYLTKWVRPEDDTRLAWCETCKHYEALWWADGVWYCPRCTPNARRGTKRRGKK